MNKNLERLVSGEHLYEISVQEDDTSLDKALFINGVKVSTISWTLSDDQIVEFLDNISQDNIFVKRVLFLAQESETKLLNIDFEEAEENAEKNAFSVNDDVFNKMNEYIEVGLPKGLATMLAVINPSDDNSISKIQNSAQKGVVMQMDDYSKESTLEMIFLLSCRIHFDKVLHVFETSGKTFKQQKHIFDSLSSVSNRVIENSGSVEQKVLNFILSNSGPISEDINNNDTILFGYAMDSLSNLDEDSIEWFKIYTKIFGESLSVDEKIEKIKLHVKDSNKSIAKFMYFIEDQIREKYYYNANKQRRAYLVQLYAMVFSYYGYEKLSESFKELITEGSLNYSFEHVIALCEHKTTGVNLSYDLIFNMAGLR